MRHHSFTKLTSIIVICLMTFSSVAFANETQLMEMVKNMQKQMNDLQSTVMAQKAEIDTLKNRPANIQMGTGATSPEVTPPMSEAEFSQRLSDSIGGASKWLKDLKFSGDLRLRYEAFHLKTNANNGYQPDRNRFRFRLRYGFEKKFSDELKVGFSMATGDKAVATGYNGDPISTNQTLGNNFNFKNIWVEKAYATYTPEWVKVGPISGFETTVGKFNNPFEKGSTDLIWDRDLKPEGIYEKVDAKLLDTESFDLKAYLTTGQLVLSESGNTGTKDASLFAYQAGLNPVFYVPGLERPVDALSAISVYSYLHYAKQPYDSYVPTGSTGTSMANGNITNTTPAGTLNAGHFNVLAFYQEVALYPYGIPVRPFAEFAHNMDNKSTLMTDSGSDAWSVGVALGKLQKKRDWQVSYQYKYIGANSVPGAFNDSDFGGYNYGGTNKAGSVFKLGYNLTDYLTMNGAYFLVDPISTRRSTANGFQLNEGVNRFQVDMTWKF